MNWLRPPTLAEAMARPHNGFAALRLALALAVVVSHGFSVVTGRAGDEPLAATGYLLGEHAVNGFFAVSGFLVAMSLDRRGARDYLVARGLRIAPGLVAATLVVALGLGAATTRLPLAAYWSDPATWRFVARTLTTLKSNADLPGVFEGNPLHLVMGTVWTLKYEVFCYAGLLAAGRLGVFRRGRAAAGVLVAGLALALVGVEARGTPPKAVETALRLPLLFALGTALYIGRERLRLGIAPVAALALTAFLARATPAYPALLFLAEGAGVIALALSRPLARAALDPRADLSYGVYLYGWPIQQCLRALRPDWPPLALLPPSLALALLAGAASWYAVERPALRLKARALGRRTLGTIEPALP